MRQYLWLLEEHDVMEYLVLAGDHLYRMDYEKFIKAHREAGADITVAALPMDEKRATAFGLMKIDTDGRIVEFAEKPKGEQLKAMKVRPSPLHFGFRVLIISLDIYVCFVGGYNYFGARC